MVSTENDDVLPAHSRLSAADGWAKYHLAHELLEQSRWIEVLALLAQAETSFRRCGEERGLWRALVGQALLHRRDGMLDLAEARCIAALQAAESTDDAFAVGYVTWQLANLKVEQEQFAPAAEYLDQAQLALDAIGLAPAGGMIASAAQLCHEIVRWDGMQAHGQIGVREATSARSAIHTDLIARLRQAGSAMQIVAAQPAAILAISGIVGMDLPPVILPPAELPSLPWIGLSAWLGQLWRKLIHGTAPATAHRVMHAPPHPTERTLDPPAIEAMIGTLLDAAEPDLPEPAGPPRTDSLQTNPPGQTSEPPEPPAAAPAPARASETDRSVPKIVVPPAIERASLPIEPQIERAAATPDPAQAEPQPGTTASRPARPTLAAQLFGPFRVILNEQLIDSWPSGRGRAVFKYILAHRDRPLPRDTLTEIFWPDATPESARNSLNVALHGLRQALRAAADVPVIVFERGAYRLNAELQIMIDVEEFRRCLQSGRRSEEAGDLAAATMRYEQAARLYQGDFMADDLSEDWPVLLRERLRVDHLDTLDQLSQIYFTVEQYSPCISLCQLILTQDSCREDVHCRLIRCYSRQSQHHLALRQYQACVDALAQELGVAPAAATTQLYERTRRREAV